MIISNYYDVRNLSCYQLVMYFLILPFFYLAYFLEYTEVLDVLPYILIIIVGQILLFNHFSHIYINSTYSLFIISFTVFICGRFVAFLFDGTIKLYDMDFFVSYTLSDIHSLSLVLYVIIGLCLLDFGYKLGYISRFSLPDIQLHHDWMKKFSLMSLLLSPIFIVEMLFNIKDAIGGGYLSSKLWQTQRYSFPLSSLAQTIFSITFGYSLITGYKKKLFLFIFIFTIFGSMIIGARGPVISAVFLYLWVLGDNGKKKINLIAMGLLFFLACLVVSFFIQVYSFRATEQEFESNIFEFIAHFIYEQGVSLMVFDLSMRVSDYPVVAYFQTFIPGSSALASLLVPVEYYMTGFQHYMAKVLDPSLFNEGYGLDWTLFSDFYVLGFENIFGFSVLAFSFGFILSILQNSDEKEFWVLLTFAIFTRLMFLPRSSLASIFPFFVYFIMFCFFLPRVRLFIK